MLEAILTTSSPFRDAQKKAMVSALEQCNLPSRDDYVRLADRLGNLELLLDDMDAKLMQIHQLVAKAAPQTSAAPQRAAAPHTAAAPKPSAQLSEAPRPAAPPHPPAQLSAAPRPSATPQLFAAPQQSAATEPSKTGPATKSAPPRTPAKTSKKGSK
jgi:hypothetical protein